MFKLTASYMKNSWQIYLYTLCLCARLFETLNIICLLFKYLQVTISYNSKRVSSLSIWKSGERELLVFCLKDSTTLFSVWENSLQAFFYAVYIKFYAAIRYIFFFHVLTCHKFQPCCIMLAFYALCKNTTWKQNFFSSINLI